MSLHLAAEYLAAKGRGPDDTLVHMSKDEVQSLRQLAQAHGGDLTINPHTGLIEAGFLSGLLPMIIGGALAATGVGAPLAALMVGGGYGIATHSLTKGLMAGLGAYGGGNLASGLGELGTQELGTKAALSGGDTLAAVQQAQASPFGTMLEGAKTLGGTTAAGQSGLSALSDAMGGKLATAGAIGAAAAPAIMSGMSTQMPGMPTYPTPNKLVYQSNPTIAQSNTPAYGQQGQNFGGEQVYFHPQYYDTGAPFKANQYPAMPQGMALGGSVEEMSNANAIGGNTQYPMAYLDRSRYATPIQQPVSENVLSGAEYSNVNPITGEQRMASGGLSDLGGYSDGGHLLRGPGDGVSDSIPATIGGKQPARLADGEFVIPARIVSELGNGSTDAGARKLYAMMDRVQQARGQTVGKGKVAQNSRADKHLPA
jgi:hypothetical protein